MPIVPAEGNPNAKICIIGEAPGNREWEQRRPFIGPSGNLLFAILRKFSIFREDCYLTNVIKDGVITSPLERLATKNKKTGEIIPSQELINYRLELIEEIKQTNCNVYVCLGNTALWALTNNQEISLWRNSILKSPIDSKKIIPTYHPAAALRDTALYDLILNDFKRVSEESLTSMTNLPERNLIVHPTLNQALTFLRRIKNEKLPFAFDVENDIQTKTVSCISFAVSPTDSISINFFDNYWNRSDFVTVYREIKSVLEDSTIRKMGHNVSHDILAMATHGIYVVPPYEDTMHKHHCVDPTAQKHSLAFVDSIFTREPYYKEWDVAPTPNIPNLESYNALDSATTFESSLKLDESLGKRKAFYVKHYQNLHPHLLEMYQHGLMIDSTKRQQLGNETKTEALKIEKEIANKMGLKQFNSNSPQQSAEIVYGMLKCKPRMKLRNKKSGIKTLSTDEETLLLLYQKEPIEVLKKIIDARELRKRLSFLEPTTKSALSKRRGEIIRTEYKPMTKTGRLSSSASTATGIGLNLQNQPKKVRSIFIPRPNQIFIELDLSQAEARVTTWDAGNIDMMHYFEMSKTEINIPKKQKKYDIHRFTASLALGIDYWKVDDLGRETNKRVRHGVNYGLEPLKQQMVILKEMGLWLPLSECKLRHRRILDSDPTIESRHERIRQEVLKNRRLITPFGRIITFHEIINDPDVFHYFGERDYSETFRIAYAFVPQSTVADMVNLALVEVNRELHAQKIGRVAAQVHDSLLLEIEDRFEAVYSATQFAKQMLERSVLINGNQLSIPADIKIGYDWSVPHEVMELDQLEEVYNNVKKT